MAQACANAQTPAFASYIVWAMTIADALDKNYARQRQLLQVAEAMPADKYSFRPTAQARTFGEQLRHIGAVQWVVGAGLLNEDPRDGASRPHRELRRPRVGTLRPNGRLPADQRYCSSTERLS